jgi:hypothetical protein
MTAKTAKRKTVKLWQYLTEHPEICEKQDLPKKVFAVVKECFNHCPLCAYNEMTYFGHMCSNCILKSCSEDSLYERWCRSETNEERQKAAQAIVDKVSEWEV